MKSNEQKQIEKLLSVIPFCKTREEAEAIQEEIIELEEIIDSACPSCGSYEIDFHDDLTCGDPYHQN